MSTAFPFTFDGATHTVTIRARRPALVVEVDGRCYTVTESTPGSDTDLVLTIDGRAHRVWRAREGERVHVKLDAHSWSVGYQDPVTAAQHEAGGEDVLRADMPGVVVSVETVHVEVNQAFDKGAELVSLHPSN